MESMGNPVEELREAVEMLNDTARERGRAQSHEHAVQELLKTVRRPSAASAKLTLKLQCVLWYLREPFIMFHLVKFTSITSVKGRSSAEMALIKVPLSGINIA